MTCKKALPTSFSFLLTNSTEKETSPKQYLYVEFVEVFPLPYIPMLPQ